MDYFKTNVEFLKQFYPNLLKIVKENPDYIEPGIIRCETRNHEPNVSLIINEQEALLHSKYNASGEAQKWALTIQGDLKNSPDVVLFGMGLGYYLEVLLQHPESKRIYLLEPSSEIFNELIRTRDIRPLLSNNKIKLVAVGSDELMIARMAKDIAAAITGKALYVAAPPIYMKLFKELNIVLNEQIKNALAEEIGNYATFHSFRDSWLKNILFNLPHTVASPPFQILRDKWKGVKAIVVGSGPSLGYDLHLLKQLRNKCLIIAAGSSIQALQHYGIQPHLVVSMDGGTANIGVFRNIDISKAPLLFISQTHFQILDNYKNNKTFALFNYDLVTPYILPNQKIPVFHSTTTVTGTAIQAARFMGANEIIFIGQDLSFPNNQYYTDGVGHLTESTLKKHIALANESGLVVRNVYGGHNIITKKMLSTLYDLELLIKVESLKGVHFINASKNGAVIEGTEFQTLEELLPELILHPDHNIELDKYIASPNQEKILEQSSLIISKLNYILKQSKIVSSKLSSLMEVLSVMELNRVQEKKTKVNDNLKLINELWSSITRTEVFSVFFTSSHLHYIKAYERYIPAIVETVNLFDKAILIIKHLGKLAMHLEEFLSLLNEVLKDSVNRLNSYLLFE